MVSTFGSLNTVVTGLMAQQLSLNTVGHNISNASTPGYSRQRVNLVASNSQQIYTNGGPAQLGLGVTSQSIIRIRDTFLDRQYWKENAILGTNITVSKYLTKVEDVFGEPSETGLQTILDKFWKSLETLSTDASNHSARAVAIQNGVQLCNTIQQEASQLKNTIADMNYILVQKVNSINEMTSELLTLNKKIVGIEAGKLDHANDLRDRRDYLVDQLSYMMDLQVTEDDDGAFIIYGGGVNLVTATSRQEFATWSHKDEDYGYEVIDIIDARIKDKDPKSVSDIVKFKNGEMAAMVESRDSEEWGIKKYLNDLSNISKFLLQEFNNVHKAGIDLNGDAGDNFFGKTGVNYNTDPITDPATGVAASFNRNDWLTHFLVNDKLIDPVTGTAKVAARTLLGEAIQSNPQSGHAIISYDPSVAAKDIMDAFKTTTPPTTPLPDPTADRWEFQNVVISAEISDSDEDGNVDGVTYSYTYSFVAVDIDGNPVLDVDGKPYIDTSITGTGTGTPIATDNGSTIFQLDGGTDPAISNLTIQVAISQNNTSGSYTFKVSGQMQGIAAGDNIVNLCNRLKVDISKTTSNSSLDTYYSTQMGILGVTAQNAERLADNQQAVIDRLQTSRESVFGVNQEEELTEMVRFQKAYNSAARILTAMDEMLDKLINGTGRVGA